MLCCRQPEGATDSRRSGDTLLHQKWVSAVMEGVTGKWEGAIEFCFSTRSRQKKETGGLAGQ